MANSRSNVFPLENGWALMLHDLGVDARAVTRRADLPDDLFSRDNATLPTPEYFRLWRAVEVELGDPHLPIRIAETVTTEGFHPVIFAAMCSSNLAVAARRVSQYKRLIAPMELHVHEDDEGLSIEYEWLDRSVEPPISLAVFELLFLVHLGRMATREHIYPTQVTTPFPPTDQGPYERFLGARIERDERHAVCFSAADARRPFLTANETMWKGFEPSLRQRLTELNASATVAERVRSALLDALPGGESSMEQIAGRLGVSKRTLQRRLRGEDTSFQTVLNQTREDLARHYLAKTSLSGGEISYLLGFSDPNSFFRAFHTWTGQTTEQVRVQHARVS